VLGVSQDGVDSHKSFCDKFGFTIDLISDTESQLMKACGIGQSEWQSVMYWDRTTFVIGPDGVIRKVYEKVKPDGHEQVLLDDIAKMGES
jgi:peroxiredoxin Q/BCP